MESERINSKKSLSVDNQSEGLRYQYAPLRDLVEISIPKIECSKYYRAPKEVLRMFQSMKLTSQGELAFLATSPRIIDVINAKNQEKKLVDYHFQFLANSAYFPENNKIVFYKTPFPESGDGIDCGIHKMLTAIFFRGLTSDERYKLSCNLIHLLKSEQAKQQQGISNLLDIQDFTNEPVALQSRIHGKHCSLEDLHQIIKETKIDDQEIWIPNVVQPDAVLAVLCEVYSLLPVEAPILPAELEDHYALYFKDRHKLSYKALRAFYARLSALSSEMENINKLSSEILRGARNAFQEDIVKHNYQQKLVDLKTRLNDLMGDFNQPNNILLKNQIKYLSCWADALQDIFSQKSLFFNNLETSESLKEKDLADKLDKLDTEIKRIHRRILDNQTKSHNWQQVKLKEQI